MLDPRRDPGLLTLGAASAGAVHLDECRTAGISRRRARLLVESGRWQSPFPRVYVVFSGPIPLETLEYAALLYAGEGAVLSHASAGYRWRLCSLPASIHVTVSYCRELADQPGLVVHRSRTLTDLDVHPALTPRRTRVERTVLDLLAVQASGEAALGLVADSIRGRLTTSDRLRASLADRPKTRWRRTILDAMPDLRAGAQSVLELRDASLRRRHGLPMGTRQWKRLADGTEHLDVLIEEWGTHVELDGRLGHDRAREVWRDLKRDNRSVVAQLRPLRYGWADMIDRSCEVAIQQAVVLRQQGWPGPFKPCSACPPDLLRLSDLLR
jgi:hypothetical protein